MRFEHSAGLFGREREVAVLRTLISRLGEGVGGALVIRGGAGAGKSALLSMVAGEARARQIAVLSAAGVQSEVGLTYAGLHRLLHPVLSRASDLPSRQRSALLTAFGLTEGTGEDTAADMFLTGLATLQLIGACAASAPVLLCVDDAQQLDQPSCDVLGFVAGRLGALPGALIVAARDGMRAPLSDAGLAEIHLDGLDERAAQALLDHLAPGLDRPVRDRLLSDADGNPLALAELATCQPPATADPPIAATMAARPLTDRLRQAFAAQAADLPAGTRCVLLVAAADEQAAIGELLGAASVVAGSAITVDALGPAVVAGLIEVERTRLRFRHPLMRLALYQSATVADRQAAHTALADVLVGRPDDRVWHEAAASLAPDERLAAALDATAARARRRGAIETATAATERAAELSETDAQRGVRLLRAADLAFDRGNPEDGPRLLGAAEQLDLTAEARIWLSWLRQAGTQADWYATANVESVIGMADRMRTGGEPRLATETLRTAALRCWWGDPDQATRAAVVAAAHRIPRPTNEPATLAMLACADPVRQAAEVISAIRGLTPDPAAPAQAYLLGSAASAVWAQDVALPFLDVAVTGLRRQGRRGLLTQALVAQAWAAVHLARGPVAMAAAAEATRLAEATGQPRWTTGANLAVAAIATARGEFDKAERLTSAAEAALTTTGPNPMRALACFVRGRGAVAHQRYAYGAGQLRKVLDPADPAYHPFIGFWGLADLVEAMAHSGQNEAARTYLARLESLAAETSAPLLRAQAGYARPMVAGDDHAEPLYQAALDRELVNWPCLRGRMMLWYGRWLRRQRRIAESRTPLRDAGDSFVALDCRGLADHARAELRASGETSRPRSPEAWDQLTPQELEIAGLAAQGMSNREIGQRLYISHRTVGYHLHRIFPKLGITSRSQLHATVTAK